MGGGGTNPPNHHERSGATTLQCQIMCSYLLPRCGICLINYELIRIHGIPVSLLFRNSKYLHGIKDLVFVGFYLLIFWTLITLYGILIFYFVYCFLDQCEIPCIFLAIRGWRGLVHGKDFERGFKYILIYL